MASSTKSLLEKLEGTTQVSSQLTYPADMSSEGHGHFILFNFDVIQGSSLSSSSNIVQNSDAVDSPYTSPVFYQQQSSSLQKSAEVRYVRSEESIALYMPESLNANYGAQWETTALGGAVGQVWQFANGDTDVNLKNLARAGKEEMIKASAGALQALTPINAKDALNIYRGNVYNQYMEVMFKGVNNRTLSLQFKFTPKNQTESIRVLEILQRLKFHMHPEFKYGTTTSAYMLPPSVVDVTFMYYNDGSAERNQWLPRYSTCAITGINVSHGGGEYSVHDDESPVTTTVDIALTELELLTKSRFDSPTDTF